MIRLSEIVLLSSQKILKLTALKTRLFILSLFVSANCLAQRTETYISEWQFSRDSMSWETVTVPHDWAISGPFDKKWDLQKVAITQNGETEATEKSGRSGALPWIGKGWYRTEVTIPDGYEHAELLFDGAMSEPQVYINGKAAGYWAYGYNAFRVDATPFISDGKLDIGVCLNNLEESSRWYPGAGIYRPVKLILTQKASIDDWSVFVKTVSIDSQGALVNVSFCAKDAVKGMKVAVYLKDPLGNFVGRKNIDMPADGKVSTDFRVNNPMLWSPESPTLYRAGISIAAMETQDDTGAGPGRGRMPGLRPLDNKEWKFGIRTVSVSKEHGFQLNGITRKLKGVCLHHDLGPLGAAVDRDALARQIKILKDMGCDAIRTAHNMPSTWQMELCDSLGMMVMAESFDMWIYPKCKNGYARFFEQWAEKDIANLVLNHRNHPSIVMWSIGNEIPEQWSEEGRNISQRLQDVIHRLDDTRPVTQGMDRAEEALGSGFAQVLDVPGFNYRVYKFDKNITQLPAGFLLGSETASTVSSRGVYKFPVVITDNSQFASYSPNYDPTALVHADGQCSSYDTEFCPWSNLPDDDFLMMDDRTYTIGQFVWTGFDYLGEPTPYDEYWPSRSSYFGICDLAGLPKDRYYLYRSQWNTEEHTLHLLPHWTWPGREGEITPVYVYTDLPEAELFVNGKSQGRIRKDITQKELSCDPQHPEQQKAERNLLDRYRLRWNNVKYEPGEIRVVAYDGNGNKALERSISTAGKANRLVMSTSLIPTTSADGRYSDMGTATIDNEKTIFITVTMTDDNGRLVPTAQDNLRFEVSGAGEYVAACNGDATSLQSFTQPEMRLFNGQAVIVVHANEDNKGDIKVRATSLESGISKEISITRK